MATSSFRPEEKKAHSPIVYDDFCKSIVTSEFDQKADTFFSKLSTTRLDDLSQTSDLLRSSFIVAEAHSQMSSKRFLIDNLKRLKEAGYKIFFMEHFFYDHQKDLDDYLQTGIFSEKLEWRLGVLDSTWGLSHIINGRFSEETKKRWCKYNFTALVVAMREAGIRIVGIDIEEIYKRQKVVFGRHDNDNRILKEINITA